MLHQSPNSMGIAWEKGDIYWVFDGYTDELVRYNFVDDHGPGNDFHGDAKLRRFSEVPIERVEGTPSHMEIDHQTDWMYIADTRQRAGAPRRHQVRRGRGRYPPRSESLAENFQMEGEIWEVFAEGLDEPCGIDLDDQWLYG